MSAATLYQLMPPLSPEEYSELTDDIRANGIQVPVIVDEDGVAIDGHHRQRIAEQLGIDCPTVVKAGLTDAEKRTMALNLNLHRRHLNREQKRQIVEASLKADPQLSDREHARRTGVSPSTAGAVRAELEESVQIGHFSERLDPRTGNASQPATKLRPASPASPDPTPEPAVIIDRATGEVTHGPAPQSRPRRTPLPEQFRDAIYDMSRKTERVSKLLDDDRFPQNTATIADHNRAFLRQTRDDLARILNALNITD